MKNLYACKKARKTECISVVSDPQPMKLDSTHRDTSHECIRHVGSSIVHVSKL